MTDKILIEPTTVMFPMATTDAKITDHKRTALLVPCIFIVILCTSLYLYMRPLGSHDAQTTSVFMNHTSQIAKPTIDQRDRIKQELKKKLPPLLADMHTADQAALTRLHQNIQADFAMYRQNIPVFIDHTTGIGSELGLMFSFMIDGNEVAGRAIQMTFEEDVVSPEQLHRNIQSHIEAFKAQLEENRQSLMIDLSYQMKDLALPQAWQHALQGQLQQIAKQKLQLSSSIAVKLAVTPIISTAAAYLAQMIAIRILAALPARVGTSILLKATKLTWFTGALFMGVDYALSEQAKADISDAVNTQLHQAEQSIQQLMQQRANVVIQQEEKAWAEKAQNIAQDLEVQA